MDIGEIILGVIALYMGFQILSRIAPTALTNPAVQVAQTQANAAVTVSAINAGGSVLGGLLEDLYPVNQGGTGNQGAGNVGNISTSEPILYYNGSPYGAGGSTLNDQTTVDSLSYGD
jgi:hypothetical protein